MTMLLFREILRRCSVAARAEAGVDASSGGDYLRNLLGRGEDTNNDVGTTAFRVGDDNLGCALLPVLCFAAPERTAAVRHVLAHYLLGPGRDAELRGAAETIAGTCSAHGGSARASTFSESGQLDAGVLPAVRELLDVQEGVRQLHPVELRQAHVAAWCCSGTLRHE